jgi:hypothetical protein
MAICLITNNPNETAEQHEQVMSHPRDSGPVPPEDPPLLIAGQGPGGWRAISAWADLPAALLRRSTDRGLPRRERLPQGHNPRDVRDPHPARSRARSSEVTQCTHIASVRRHPTSSSCRPQNGSTTMTTGVPTTALLDFNPTGYEVLSGVLDMFISGRGASSGRASASACRLAPRTRSATCTTRRCTRSMCTPWRSTSPTTWPACTSWSTAARSAHCLSRTHDR